MKAAAFDYARAEDAGHAVSLLQQAAGHARPIAGGQSLGPMLNLRLARPDLLVDIGGCADLRGCQDEGDALVYGAALTHAEIEDGAVPDATGGWLARAARRIAYRAVRNRGTLGGSIVHGDPAADWLTVMLALDAEVILRGAHGLRALRLQDFCTGPFTNALQACEILVALRVRKRDAGFQLGYRKVSVKVGEFARALAVVARDGDGGCTRAVVGAIERRPLVLDGPSALAGDTVAAQALIGAQLPRLAPHALRLHAVTLARAVADLRPIAEAP